MGHDDQERTIGTEQAAVQEPLLLRVVVYVRISDDPEGTERGVDRQEADCRAYATARGWEVVRGRASPPRLPRHARHKPAPRRADAQPMSMDGMTRGSQQTRRVREDAPGDCRALDVHLET